jgi:hypothetical protein
MTSAIPGVKFEMVFIEWEERLQRCSDINGAYVN